MHRASAASTESALTRLQADKPPTNVQGPSSRTVPSLISGTSSMAWEALLQPGSIYSCNAAQPGIHGWHPS